MENEGDILSVFLDENITINYTNGVSEILPKTLETYSKFYNCWLVANPPFISDKFKVQMRDIIMTSLNGTQENIEGLNTFFQTPNEESVKNFFTFMRSRHLILPQQKAQWTPV